MRRVDSDVERKVKAAVTADATDAREIPAGVVREGRTDGIGIPVGVVSEIRTDGTGIPVTVVSEGRTDGTGIPVTVVSESRDILQDPKEVSGDEPSVRQPLPVNVPLEILALPYASSMCFTLADGNISNFAVIKDDLNVLDLKEIQSYAELVNEFCAKHVLEPWREEYQKIFAVDALEGSATNKAHMLSYSFPSNSGRLHQDTYVYLQGSDVALFVGLQPEKANENGALALQKSENNLSNAIADMQIEMQFERKEMKSHTRRIAIACTLLALLVGCVGGAILDRQGGVFSNILNQFFTKEAEETQETVEEVEPTATAEPIVPTYVSRDSSATFTADIASNGTARTVASITDYDTGTFTASVTDVLGPDDFASKYTKYTLDGTEACVALEIDFESLDDKDLEVIPQDAFLISMTGANGEQVEEYQLMDKEIAGSYAASIKDGKKQTFYKRYKYSEDIDYLVLSSFKDGTRSDYYFALKYDDPNVTHEELKSGDKNTMVYYLKAKLSELGYYDGSIDKSFNSATEDAVKSAQADFGMEQTGIADNDFQQMLYSK